MRPAAAPTIAPAPRAQKTTLDRYFSDRYFSDRYFSLDRYY
jgi:hypothetical protein